jgi:hypothetical protein
MTNYWPVNVHVWAFLCIDFGSTENVPTEPKMRFEQANALQINKLIWLHPTRVVQCG